jgi:hypothetical protein
MSTRCQIKVKGSEIHIYKHSDGYPSDVLPTLVPFVKRFFKDRGADPAYLLCQIIRAFAVRDFKNGMTETEEDFKPKEGENFTCKQDYLGWGLDCEKHGDIEYLYEVDSSTGAVFVNNEKVTELTFKRLTKEEK